MLMLFLLVLVNIGISFWNAKEAGRCWAESKGVGGWVRILVWCAAIQSAVGFTMSYAIIIGTIAHSLGYISSGAFGLLMNLIYVMIIVPALGSGIAITIHSWIAFAREKSLSNLGIAGWNTFATAYNTYNAVQNFGAALSNVTSSFGSLFSGDEDSDSSNGRVLLLAAIAVLAGILSTMVIIQKYAASIPVSEEIRNAGRRDLSYR